MGERICKARLGARGFEEEIPEWEKDASTCNAETLKFCLTFIKLKKCICYTLDVKTAYLQGDEIERGIFETTKQRKLEWSVEIKEKCLWIEGCSKGKIQ